MTNNKFTTGPWRWEMNEKSKGIMLVGGKPLYDSYIMDFVRWGTQRATPRFNTDGIMYPAKDHGLIVKGREHHADWFKDIDHPDARLISAAPDLLEALQRCILLLEETNVETSSILEAKAAIAKATGEVLSTTQ